MRRPDYHIAGLKGEGIQDKDKETKKQRQIEKDKGRDEIKDQRMSLSYLCLLSLISSEAYKIFYIKVKIFYIKVKISIIIVSKVLQNKHNNPFLSLSVSLLSLLSLWIER